MFDFILHSYMEGFQFYDYPVAVCYWIVKNRPAYCLTAR